MKRLLITLLFLIGLPLHLNAQEVVTGLSENEIELTPSFRGQDLLLFGTIKDKHLLDSGRFEIAIVIQGEHREHVVRKKERVFGFWVNYGSKTLDEVPEFYALASTRPLEEIANDETRRALSLGLDQQDFYQSNKDDEAALGYVEGLIRTKEAENMYQFADDGLEVQSDILFQAEFFFPADVPSGTYTARAYLFQGGELVGWTDKNIQVQQGGLARGIYNLAHNNSALYGILAILIALAAGWAAGFITQGRSKLS